jgi:hypothetical protein
MSGPIDTRREEMRFRCLAIGQVVEAYFEIWTYPDGYRTYDKFGYHNCTEVENTLCPVQRAGGHSAWCGHCPHVPPFPDAQLAILPEGHPGIPIDPPAA